LGCTNLAVLALEVRHADGGEDEPGHDEIRGGYA
jgi:hypothetical protein